MASYLDEVYGGAAHVAFWLGSGDVADSGRGVRFRMGIGSRNRLLHRIMAVCPFAMFLANACWNDRLAVYLGIWVSLVADPAPARRCSLLPQFKLHQASLPVR